MAVSQNDTPRSQPVPTDAQEREKIYEDEINLMDYFRVLWKRKSLILLGSVLPAFIVGLILFFLPRNYKVTYVYDVKDQDAYDVKDQDAYDFKGQDAYDVSNWNLNQNNYKILLGRFYSDENTNKIKAKLQGYNPEAVNFEVSPSYMDLSKTKITNPFELEQIRQLEVQLLNMTITGRPKNNISKISSVIRDNFENIMPVYMVQNQLSSSARACRGKMASIEENKFNQELVLKTSKAVLAKLKSIKTKTSDTRQTNIALQFDISGKTEYLPVEYQIQATESKTVQLEEQIAANEETYNHYKDLLALNKKLLAELKGKMSSQYTIQQFRLFLIDLIGGYEKEELKDYLNSYIKKIENRISASAPIMQKPRVYTLARGTLKKTAITFVMLLTTVTFVAFLLESAQKS